MLSSVQCSSLDFGKELELTMDW